MRQFPLGPPNTLFPEKRGQNWAQYSRCGLKSTKKGVASFILLGDNTIQETAGPSLLPGHTEIFSRDLKTFRYLY